MAPSRPTRPTSNADQPASIVPVRAGEGARPLTGGSKRPHAGEPHRSHTGETQRSLTGEASGQRSASKPVASKPAASKPAASKPAKPRPATKNSPQAKGSRRAAAATGPTRAATATGPTRTAPSSSQGSAGFAGASGGPSALRPAGQPRLGWVKPFSLRLMILGLLILLTFALLIPTFMRYLEQQQQLSSMREQVATAQERNQDLSAELDRWKDSTYVIAQARERLSFVFPGETAYKVIDPESVTDTTNPVTGKEVTDGAVKFPIGKAQTWYGTLWDSVKVAGSVEVDATTPSAKK